jgi:hypothetical protein
MEMLGLAMVVLLVAGGILIAYRFKATEPKSAAGWYSDKELASSLVSTMQNTYVPECRATMSELFIDCYANHAFTCTGGGAPSDSCQVANKVAKIVLDSTLGEWGRNYHFYSSTQGTKIDDINTCDETMDRVSVHPPLPTAKGDLVLSLEICTSQSSQ